LKFRDRRNKTSLVDVTNCSRNQPLGNEGYSKMKASSLEESHYSGKTVEVMGGH
jgi:hypothetical protein